jgi:hypothetical protein
MFEILKDLKDHPKHSGGDLHVPNFPLGNLLEHD